MSAAIDSHQNILSATTEHLDIPSSLPSDLDSGAGDDEQLAATHRELAETQRYMQDDAYDNHADWSEHFFPLLPYSYDGEMDLSQWQIECSSKHQDQDRVTVVQDMQLNEPVIELYHHGRLITTAKHDTFIAFPSDPDSRIGTTFPILNLQLKNLDKYSTLQCQCVDSTMTLRSFRFSNSQSIGRVVGNVCELPLKLREGWNRLAIDLQYLCHSVYGTEYHSAVRVTVYASCRLRRVFFSDCQYKRHSEMPPSLQLDPKLVITR